MAFDVAALRAHFPILASAPGGSQPRNTPSPLTYLDSAATAQKPRAVLDAVRTFYQHTNANVHRSQHPLSEAATQAFERARETVRDFLHARSASEIIVTKGTTEAINLVARSLGSQFSAGDRTLVSRLEHHANIVPWMQVCTERGAELRWIECDERGALHMDQLVAELSSKKVKIVCVTGQSNVLGVRPELRKIADLAHAVGAHVLVDAAQLVVHGQIDVQALDCDFLAFSGHKLYGPGGVGVLYGKKDLLDQLPPFLGGGMMIADVRDDGFTPADVPARFEAGTPPAAEFVGLAAAIDWLLAIPVAERDAHERALISAALETLRAVPGVRVLGSGEAATTFGCVSFVADSAHPHDIAHLLGEQGICIRAGHHCAQLLHRRLGIPAGARLSVALYNTEEEVRSVGPALERVLARLW